VSVTLTAKSSQENAPLTKCQYRSSTLENWAREFEKFAPNLDVRTYYGSQDERRHLQREYKDMFDDGTLEVLLTTYDLAWKDDDNKFLRKRLQFEVWRPNQSNETRLGRC
jgi:SNF2 family DNA or RNA helicase